MAHKSTLSWKALSRRVSNGTYISAMITMPANPAKPTLRVNDVISRVRASLCCSASTSISEAIPSTE